MKYPGLTGWAGYEWNNPPAPFNPRADPRAAGWYAQVTKSMQDDGLYERMSQEECGIEWRRRYDEVKRKAGPHRG